MAYWQIDKGQDKQTKRLNDRNKYSQAERQTEIQTERQRETEIKTNRERKIETGRMDRQTDGQTRTEMLGR